MSDSEPDFDDPRFLVDVPTPSTHEQSYAERRKRKVIESERKGRANSSQSRAQLELEQREIGLGTNLVDRAKSDDRGGESKAFKMMQAMGFNPGDSLGKPSSAPPRFAKASFSPATPSSASVSARSDPEPTVKPANEPIKFQIRTGRTGLGIPQRAPPRVVPSTSSSSSSDPTTRRGDGDEYAIDSTPLPDLGQFLEHLRATLDSKRAYGILKSCRRTLEELDRRNGIDGDVEGGRPNVMWFDPDELERDRREFRNKRLFDQLDHELDSGDDDASDDDDDIKAGRRDQRDGRGGEGDEQREQSELDYLRGKSDTVVELEHERIEREQARADQLDAEDRRRADKRERKLERQQRDEWFALDVSTRLALTLSYLRHHYHYCFYCGCQYNDAKDLEENCPGTEEEDH